MELFDTLITKLFDQISFSKLNLENQYNLLCKTYNLSYKKRYRLSYKKEIIKLIMLKLQYNIDYDTKLLIIL